ncbi:MAG: response regulator [Herpetosiphonaceae bacterium]|nr:response regulator [Herpetosiphonaceae bacterium]
MMAPTIPAILVVEDEPDILMILRRILRDVTSEYDIIAVPHARTALKQLALQDCALVITDYAMPDMTGLDLAQHIQRMAPQTPVVMITAYANPELLHAAKAAGVVYVLYKPFSVGELEQVLRTYLP